MTSLRHSWILQLTGPPLIEWLCGHCDGYLFEVNYVQDTYGTLYVRSMTCTHCGAFDVMSTVGLAPPPPGYAVYRVEWRAARFRPPAFPAEPAAARRTGVERAPFAVQVVAASRVDAHRQAVGRRVDELSGLECLIDGEPYLPQT